MTSRHDCEAVPSDTSVDRSWLPTGYSIAIAVVLGAAAGMIVAFAVALVRAEGLVSWQ
jgi:hypothetical protein